MALLQVPKKYLLLCVLAAAPLGMRAVADNPQRVEAREKQAAPAPKRRFTTSYTAWWALLFAAGGVVAVDSYLVNGVTSLVGAGLFIVPYFIRWGFHKILRYYRAGFLYKKTLELMSDWLKVDSSNLKAAYAVEYVACSTLVTLVSAAALGLRYLIWLNDPPERLVYLPVWLGTSLAVGLLTPVLIELIKGVLALPRLLVGIPFEFVVNYFRGAQ